MAEREDRRHVCNRIIGVERRGAPIQSLEGHALPDPTQLIDEDFEEPVKPRKEIQPDDHTGH